MKAIAGVTAEDDADGVAEAGASVGVTGKATSAGSTDCGTSRESFFSGTVGFASDGDGAAPAPEVGQA